MFNQKFVSSIVFAITFLVGGFLMSSGSALAADATLSAQSFTVWNQGGIVGYDAGFSLSGATFNNAQSIVIKLYSGNTVLQTNTAIAGKFTGTGLLTPFDVFGTFNYAADGYVKNQRSREYGQNVIPTEVVASVTLADGTTLTATNLNLSGNPQSIHSYNGKVLGASSFHFAISMKNGSRGGDVLELQRFLAAGGYYTGALDSDFGQMTKAAVIKFQSANSLKIDGIVGSGTRAALNK